MTEPLDARAVEILLQAALAMAAMRELECQLAERAGDQEAATRAGQEASAVLWARAELLAYLGLDEPGLAEIPA